jgi:hypothetical protein
MAFFDGVKQIGAALIWIIGGKIKGIFKKKPKTLIIILFAFALTSCGTEKRCAYLNRQLLIEHFSDSMSNVYLNELLLKQITVEDFIDLKSGLIEGTLQQIPWLNYTKK